MSTRTSRLSFRLSRPLRKAERARSRSRSIDDVSDQDYLTFFGTGDVAGTAIGRTFDIGCGHLDNGQSVAETDQHSKLEEINWVVFLLTELLSDLGPNEHLGLIRGHSSQS